MNITTLKALQAKATPGRLRIRQHPEDEDMCFVEADTYEGHPYHGVSSGFEIGGDEDYPTKRADMELIVELWNTLLDIPLIDPNCSYHHCGRGSCTCRIFTEVA